MTNQGDLMSRREFIHLAGAMGVEASLLSACASGTIQHGDEAKGANLIVPKRAFGASGEMVSTLALGGFFDPENSLELLEAAYALGVTYWEITGIRGGKGHGAYLRLHPGHREDLFLLAKAKEPTPEAAEAGLIRALSETGSTYIDFFVIHALSDAGAMTSELRQWVERTKREGRIRYFGFTTHSNMQRCLHAASEMDWIDGVVAAYNYRLMQDPRMEDALHACAGRGIAITAIKSQALPTNPNAAIGVETSASSEALRRLGLEASSLYEARLRAVWSNPAITSICSLMPDPSTLISNALAARRGSLDREAMVALESEARESSSSYCAGCSTLCQAGRDADVPIRDVMRYLMYARSYGDSGRARGAFAELPATVKRTIENRDFAGAERRCPQKLPIGALLKQAAHELGGPSSPSALV